MKRTLLLVSICLIANAVLAITPRSNTLMSRQQPGLSYRPIEQAAMPKSAQQWLVSYNTDDDYQVSRFYYDNGNKLIANYECVIGEYELYDSVRYNNQGQLVRLDGYQWMNNTWKNVYYIEYTYNGQGLIASRTNYNLFSNEWNLGGIYNYTYNAAGQLIKTELTMSNQVIQKIEYSYTNGLLNTETWFSGGFGSPMEAFERMTYTYTDGRLTTMYDSIYGSTWSYNGKEEYQYDASGNCTHHIKYDGGNMVTEKSIYEFNDQLLENTVTPYHPELIRPVNFNNHNNYTREQWYTLDVDFHLQYVCDYIYNYNNQNVGIANTEEASLIRVYPNPASNHLHIEGLAEGCSMVEILDMSGRVVLAQRLTSDRVDISRLQTGMYLLRTAKGQQCARFVVE